tara:strand:- start:494 stop:811 length:318 start_codon:yes stop_codon:yes gene_type:complete
MYLDDLKSIKEYNYLLPPVPYDQNKFLIKNVTNKNYITYPVNLNKSTRELWHNSYKNHLINMYFIIIDIIEREFNQKNFYWSQKSFNNFSKLIYHCSSKFISPYL